MSGVDAINEGASDVSNSTNGSFASLSVASCVLLCACLILLVALRASRRQVRGLHTIQRVSVDVSLLSANRPVTRDSNDEPVDAAMTEDSPLQDLNSIDAADLLSPTQDASIGAPSSGGLAHTSHPESLGSEVSTESSELKISSAVSNVLPSQSINEDFSNTSIPEKHQSSVEDVQKSLSS